MSDGRTSREQTAAQQHDGAVGLPSHPAVVAGRRPQTRRCMRGAAGGGGPAGVAARQSRLPADAADSLKHPSPLTPRWSRRALAHECVRLIWNVRFVSFRTCATPAPRASRTCRRTHVRCARAGALRGSAGEPTHDSPACRNVPMIAAVVSCPDTAHGVMIRERGSRTPRKPSAIGADGQMS